MDFGVREAHAQKPEARMREVAEDSPEAGTRAPERTDAYLSHWNALGELRRWPLPATGAIMTIGRSSAADVCLAADPQVSRLHATLEHIGGEWTISDDGLSSNGTSVNGRRVSHRVRLRDRDMIRVGSTTLTFCAPQQQPSAATVAGVEIPAIRRLTQPQRLVLAALCRHYRDGQAYALPATNQQIAAELSLSLDAVKTHLRVLYHKFGIEELPQNQKRARLAALAMELGLMSDL
jgi:FHA domain